jgi:hypothetical protein
MDEKRSVTRRRTYKAGTIVFNRAGGISTTVRNLSDLGAMLEVESVLDIPDEFTLTVSSEHFNRRCQVIWRQAKRLGVRFV